MNVSIKATIAIISISIAGCGDRGNQQKESEFMTDNIKEQLLPTPEQWVSSPLRNRLTLRLSAPIEKVWDLVGDPTNMPKYSDGLNKVESLLDEGGKCLGYTCYFKPMEGEKEGITHFSKVIWHEQNSGWASMDEDNNQFGTLQSLSLLTIQPDAEGTILTWQFHFNGIDDEALEFNKNGYFAALVDISQRLRDHFGGAELENYREGQSL